MNSALEFAALAERHRSEILHYLIRLLGNEPDAQDVCQDVFLRAHRAFARLAPDSNARAWLYRIATNTAINAKRQRAHRASRTVETDPDALPATLGSQPIDHQTLRALRQAVEALPPRQRAALMLRQFQDMDYAQIAASIGGSAATARANVYQAIKTLRTTLGGIQ